MAYTQIWLQNIAELENRRGNAVTNLLAAILGTNYPIDENYTVYEWKNSSTTAPDGYEVVAPVIGDTSIGRWFRVDNAQLPQVNADWNSSSGPSQILNKPAIPSAQISSDWNAVSGVAQILNKPIIPSVQVNSDWNSSTGYSQILNKPVFSSVAYSGLYSDLLGKPVFSAVSTTGSYNDLTNKPVIPASQVNSDWNSSSGLSQILNKPSLSTVAVTGLYTDLSGKPSLSSVATSGSYNDLINKPAIPNPVGFGAPTSRSLSKGIAYQAIDNTKPAIITVNLTSTSSASLSGVTANAARIVIGTTNAVASGTGTAICKYNNTLGGTLLVGLNVTNTSLQAYTINLPSGWYFAILDTTGTGTSIDSAFDQVVTN